MNFKKITNEIESDLKIFEQLLNNVAGDSELVVKEVLDYIFESKGKRIRPVLVYLCARLFAGSTQSTHNAAILIEIMHTATLLHDDVVDKANLRRGKKTLNNKWDDKTAILTGDYLFAKAMKLATDNNEYYLFDIITPAIMSMSLGELQQMDKSRKFDVDEKKYYEIIRNKTAALIAVSCQAGAYTGGANQEQIKVITEFGEILGMIFQIKDDILDYTGNNNTGKEVGVDIKEGKVTLPLIMTWKSLSENDRKILLYYWEKAANCEGGQKFIINMVKNKNGILLSNNIMLDYKNRANNILLELPNNKVRLALSKLIDYVIDRDK
ncbi:MAG: polyprenyl synthetase family protein [Bacteroidales bacterium]|nr:polyprenyl synthetase family protein [Bacteroidales bacterium]